MKNPQHLKYLLLVSLFHLLNIGCYKQKKLRRVDNSTMLGNLVKNFLELIIKLETTHCLINEKVKSTINIDKIVDLSYIA
jgi:hypothetical protein